MSLKLKCELTERLREIMECHNTDYLIASLFDFLDTPTLMELIDFMEFREGETTSNQN